MTNIPLNHTQLLVVDPRPDDYLHLTTELQSHEYRLQFATCGEEALQQSASPRFDAWIINFRLPDMAGPDLLDLIRERTPGAAYVLISDSYSAVDELAARQRGATFFTCKPLLAEWLHSLPIASNRRRRQHLAHGPPRASPQSHSTRSITTKSTEPT